MQTEQRSSKKEDGTTQRRDTRPRHFDAGIRIQSEGGGGQPPFAEGWGQQSYQYAPGLQYAPGYQSQPTFVPGQPFGPFQAGGFANANLAQTQFGSGPMGFGMPQSPNPLAALAPTLSYGLAGLADALYRGVALATAQGQALINTVRPMQGFASQKQPVAWPSARVPATDIVDEGGELVCQIELPGVKPENVDIACHGRGILVTAQADPDIDLGALVQAERGLQVTYRRAVPLPAAVNPSGAKARLRDGVLTINVPKTDPTEGPRRVPVE